MRIDIKKVKGKEYVQLVDKRGHVFHVGPAADYDSWLIAFMIWEKEWRQEYIRKREETFDKIGHEIGKHISVSSLEIQALDALKHRGYSDFRLARKSMRVPQTSLFGSLVEKDNPEQDNYPYTWQWNKRAEQLRKRLKDITFKQRRIKRKEEKTNLEVRKEEQMDVIANLKANQEKRNKVLSLIAEIQMADGLVGLQEITNEANLRYKLRKDEVENILFDLLRDGTIYEHKEGFYRIT